MTQSVRNHKNNCKWNAKDVRKILAEEANELRVACGIMTPPYDPYLIASKLQVEVEERYIQDFDGYIEIRDQKYVAVISTKKHPTRQRFTLGHELGHVVLMRLAESNQQLVRRYRTDKKFANLHQDPVEESLCNYFAGELLMPAAEVKHKLQGKTTNPETVFNLANEFHVSIQAAAVNLLKAKRGIIACTMWSLDSLWPLPIWWVGLKTKLLSELKDLEYLVGKRQDCTDLWRSYAERDCHFEIQVAPTPEMRFAMILIRYSEDFTIRRRW